MEEPGHLLIRYIDSAHDQALRLERRVRDPGQAADRVRQLIAACSAETFNAASRAAA